MTVPFNERRQINDGMGIARISNCLSAWISAVLKQSKTKFHSTTETRLITASVTKALFGDLAAQATIALVLQSRPIMRPMA